VAATLARAMMTARRIISVTNTTPRCQGS
jgi:hypothetical protein